MEIGLNNKSKVRKLTKWRLLGRIIGQNI